LSGVKEEPATQKNLRVLLVEDNPDDAELVLLELRHAGYQPSFRRVQTGEEMTAALTNEAWEVIVSDHSLPRFSAPEAFAIVRAMNIDIPFIIVSGTVGEEVAVKAMRTGVHDFLLKGHLKRLVAAIEREIREADMRAERRKIQEQLLISERMASMGTLAAGVAHEINNPLSVVVGNLHVIRQDLEALVGRLNGQAAALPATDQATGQPAGLSAGPGSVQVEAVASALRESVRDAEEAAERVRVIVRDLRVFSRPDDDLRGSVDVHKVLESSLRMARNELRQRARITLDFGAVPNVDGNEGRLGQVFLNLLVNAAHAIPEGRTGQNDIAVRTKFENGMVVVEISDTGSGIAPDVLPKIFDAFFTTKPIGIGTGLGLAICHRILTSLNGRIEVKSQVDLGTTFRVLLPPARAARTQSVPMLQRAVPATAARRGSILVIEDEPALCRVLERLLLPHRVTTVMRAREALARIQAGEKFSIILCDLMMPEMTGMEFYGELIRHHGVMANRVIFMSGGVLSPHSREFLEKVPNLRLDKPIDTTRLHQLVDEAVGLELPRFGIDGPESLSSK
jgi:signal transduction histidine kinase